MIVYGQDDVAEELRPNSRGAVVSRPGQGEEFLNRIQDVRRKVMAGLAPPHREGEAVEAESEMP